MDLSGTMYELKAIHWQRILRGTPNNGLALPLCYHRPDAILTQGSHETFEKFPSLVAIKDGEIIKTKIKK